MAGYKIGNGRGRHKQQWNQAMKVTAEDDGDGTIVVTMPYDEDAKAELKAKFQARWDPDEKVWCIDSEAYDIDDVIRELRVHFPRAIQ